MKLSPFLAECVPGVLSMAIGSHPYAQARSSKTRRRIESTPGHISTREIEVLPQGLPPSVGARMPLVLDLPVILGRGIGDDLRQ